MIAYQNLIDELETAFATKTLGRRRTRFWRVTDLFLTGSGQYREEVIDLFDEIFGRLYRDIALASRIELAKQLADVADAPVGLMRKMARDDAIEVAGPSVVQIDPAGRWNARRDCDGEKPGAFTRDCATRSHFRKGDRHSGRARRSDRCADSCQKFGCAVRAPDTPSSSRAQALMTD